MSLSPPDSGSTPRQRSRMPVIEVQEPLLTGIDSNGAVKWLFKDTPKLVRESTDSIRDRSIPDFHRRSAAGEIFNNAMYRKTVEIQNPLLWCSYFDNTWRQSSFSGTMYIPLPQPLLSTSYKTLAENAITDAYAGISANEGNTLLWLGEMKETVKMLGDIGSRIQILREQTSSQRKKWAKGLLSVKEQQSLTLALLYGILPLEQQIADFMSGLFSIKENKSRQTSRGFRISTDSASEKRVVKNDNIKAVTQTWTETVEVHCRAGVLYDVDTTDFPWLSVILDPKSIVSTAYALSRLSFVVDWFINVGGTLAAWSPSAGTKVLSAWVTIEVTRTVEGTRSVKAMSLGRNASGGSKFSSTTTEKWRVPVTRADLAIFPRFDVNLNLSKVSSLILLFAKTK